MSQQARRRRRGHRHRIHRHRPRRGPAPHRRRRPRAPRQHARARREPAPTAWASPRAYDDARRPARRRRGPGRPRHLPQRAPLAPGDGDPRRRTARRLREAAGDDVGGVGRARRAGRGRRGLVNAVNFNIRFYPLNQHVAELVRDGGVGDVRLVTGRYFQDWLLHDTDWNWRLEPERGGALRAVGDIGSHWLDLTTFVTGLHVEAVMADLTTFIPVRHQPTGPVETFSTERAGATPCRVEIRTEDVATILLRFEGGARGVVGDLAAERRAARTPSSTRSTAPRPPSAWDSEQPDQLWIGHRDRPNEILLRNPALMNRPAPPPRASRAGTSRASPTRSAPCSRPSTTDVARRAGPARRPATRRSPTATTRCSWGTRSPRARARAAGSTSPATRAGRRTHEPPPPIRRTGDAAR